MMVDNTDRENQLIEYLLNYAYEHNIGYVLFQADPHYPSITMKSKREIRINLNWHNHSPEVPFTIAHEIGHVMIDSPDMKQFDCIGYGTQIEEESPADVFALHLLYKYSCLQEDGFYDPLSFLKAYGIPLRMIHEAYDMFAEENNCTPYEYWHDLKNSYY